MIAKINRFNITLAAFGILLIFILMLSQIVLRLFDLYIPSVNQICGYLMVTSFFLALGFSFEQGKHIRVSLIFELTPTKHHNKLKFIGLIIAALLSLFMCYASLMLTLDSFRFNEVASGELALIEWPIQAIMTYSCIIFALTVFKQFTGNNHGAA